MLILWKIDITKFLDIIKFWTRDQRWKT